mmetsp:Transcript_47255/g.110523  ORF Transcript_47255/g.110523 Transcript_47255/m.110523 type:complete len:195 (+) Transcript_47255:1383-1967(+)
MPANQLPIRHVLPMGIQRQQDQAPALGDLALTRARREAQMVWATRMALTRALLAALTAWARVDPVVPKKAPTKATASLPTDLSKRQRGAREVQKIRMVEMETHSPSPATGQRLLALEERKKLSKKVCYLVNPRRTKTDAWHYGADAQVVELAAMYFQFKGKGLDALAECRITLSSADFPDWADPSSRTDESGMQ